MTALTGPASPRADDKVPNLQGSLLDAGLAAHALRLSDEINFILALALSRKAMTVLPADEPVHTKKFQNLR